jgi:hypothetical protein
MRFICVYTHYDINNIPKGGLIHDKET